MARTDVSKSSIQIVQTVLDTMVEKSEIEASSVNWENLRRIANRARQKYKTNVHTYSQSYVEESI